MYFAVWGKEKNEKSSSLVHLKGIPNHQTNPIYLEERGVELEVLGDHVEAEEVAVHSLPRHGVLIRNFGGNIYLGEII